MPKFTLDWIKHVTGAKVIHPDPDRAINGVAIDSRETKSNDLFVCLPGERTDGHLYLDQAYQRGANASLITTLDRIKDSDLAKFHNLIQVKDTTEALHQLAKSYRHKFDIPMVGITGSSGKTTTKELLWHILSDNSICYRSAGNYNTQYGLPMALLNMPGQTQIGIFELAMQKKGEISQLAEILKPTYGLITVIGDAHLGNFANKLELAQAKWELMEKLPSSGTAILNFDSKFLRSHAPDLELILKKVISFSVVGKVERARFYTRRIDDRKLTGLSFKVIGDHQKFQLDSNLLGEFNVVNILAAVTAAYELGTTIEDIKRGVRKFNPVSHRMEKRKWGQKGIILDDSYNANPYSTEQALRTLDRLEVNGHKKVFVFGDMRELGHRAVEAHRGIGRFISNLDIDLVFTLGELAKWAGEYLLDKGGWLEEKVIVTRTREELERVIKDRLTGKRCIILVKGSREMELDRLVSRLL